MRRLLTRLAVPLVLTAVVGTALTVDSPSAEAAAPTVTATASSEAPGTNVGSLLTAPISAPQTAASTAAAAGLAAAQKAAATASAKAAAATKASTTAAAASTRAARTAAKAKAKVKAAKKSKAKAKARAKARSKARAARVAKSRATAAARAAATATADAKAKAAAVAAARSAANGTSWRRATWRSVGETRGARVDLRWSAPAPVSRVVLVGASTAPQDRISAAVLTFGDGSSLQLTPSSAGDLSVAFPRRTVSTATLAVESGVAGSTVSLSALRLDDAGSWSAARPSESVTATQGDASAARDGDPSTRALGRTWSAGSVPSASVNLRWSNPRVIASVVALGLEQNVVDPAASSSDPIRGELVFSDGSRIPLPGISGGASEPTVVAFTPRIATGVEVKLTRLAPGAAVGLREVGVYDVGVTPPRIEARGAGYDVSSAVPTASCDPAARAAGNAKLLLLCPETGSSVNGTTTVAVRADAGSLVTARAWLPSLGVTTVGRATASYSGIATISVDTRTLPKGPLNIGLVKGEASSTRPFVYAQMVNRGGVATSSKAAGRPGMTLQWDDDFGSPLSVSSWGENASYAAVKPEYWGEGAFSDAVFAKPESGANTLGNDGGYLRIRAKSIGTGKDPNGWGRKHVGGIMSSMRVGGSGFSAQHGYFEARMLGAPGKGSWPAFWMLDSTSATRAGYSAAETDAVELYGHSTLGSCHTIHTWTPKPTGSGDCPDPNGFGDWALGWHTYGVQIVPNGADFYIDGVKVASKRGQDYTDRPMYFMLNLALGGGWPVDLAATGETTDLWVDWVRVYT